jgi:hypothetical protein
MNSFEATGGLQSESRDIIDALRYSKMCAGWVPRSLTYDQKSLRIERCVHIRFPVTRLMVKAFVPDRHLGWNMDPTDKKSAEWHHPTAPQKNKFKASLSAGKLWPLFYGGGGGEG